MKIIYLLPPSEGKNSGGIHQKEKLSFSFEKPIFIAIHASEKDLKCIGKRYNEGIKLNKDIDVSEVLPTMERYTGVMYSAIDYCGMPKKAQEYFAQHFLILSGMYGISKPEDMIGNYKLPIETKGLYKFWGEKITDSLNQIQADIIVDLLPKSYSKMIDWKKIEAKILRVEFFHVKHGEDKKISHGVKKIKGVYIKNICETKNINIPDFGSKKELILKIVI